MTHQIKQTYTLTDGTDSFAVREMTEAQAAAENAKAAQFADSPRWQLQTVTPQQDAIAAIGRLEKLMGIIGNYGPAARKQVAGMSLEELAQAHEQYKTSGDYAFLVTQVAKSLAWDDLKAAGLITE